MLKMLKKKSRSPTLTERSGDKSPTSLDRKPNMKNSLSTSMLNQLDSKQSDSLLKPLAKSSTLKNIPTPSSNIAKGRDTLRSSNLSAIIAKEKVREKERREKKKKKELDLKKAEEKKLQEETKKTRS